jgi:uncharacterized protein YigA (DUF484 family)
MTTVGEALNRRSDLQKRIAQLEERAATDRGLFGRYSRSEIRMVRQIRVSDVQSEVDARAKERRELDNDLQEHNWTTQLIE